MACSSGEHPGFKGLHISTSLKPSKPLGLWLDRHGPTLVLLGFSGFELPRLARIHFFDFWEMLHELKLAHERAAAKVRQATAQFGVRGF